MVKLVTATYLLLVAAVAIQRLIETRISRRHERLLLARGAVEHAREQMPFMIALHGAWLLACVVEVWLLARPFQLVWAVPALLVFGAGQALRLAAMRTLGERWTVKVITLFEEPAVERGIFRYVRHPNYLGVILEIAALPLVHGAWLTAAVFSLLNGALLYARVRAEERALEATGDYAARFRDRPRFVPHVRPSVHEGHV
ncbi:MAG: isoprenylcysteine carboxylmethyltransferase family protein [Polyangiales bacterium]